MKGQWAKFWEQLRTSFWFVPTLMVLGASVLAIVTIWLDESQRFAFVTQIGWMYSGGPEGARALLSSVAGSIITVAGVTFSITIAALTLASSQFGPRLLRSFVRDTGNQVVLGTFIATFLYCLLVLRTVRGIEDIQFVPHISVTVAVGLAVASLGVLIYFIHHVATAIQVEHIIAAVGTELDEAIDRIFPEQLGSDPKTQEHPTAREILELESANEVYAVVATNGGYVQVIETDALMHIASTSDLVVQLAQQAGDFIVRGDTLAHIWPKMRGDAQLAEHINNVFLLGMQRTTIQDVAFAVSQLVEIAVRALSPGINDPFTAVACIDRLAAALCRVAERAMPSPYRYDDARILRVIANGTTFADLTAVAFDQIRQNGRAHVVVTLRLLEMLAVITTHTQAPAHRAALLRQATFIRHDVHQQMTESFDWHEVAERCEQVVRRIKQR